MPFHLLTTVLNPPCSLSTRPPLTRTLVPRLQIVLPSGEVRRLAEDAAADASLLAAARQGLGRMGVVVELELRVQPLYWVRPRTVLLPVSALCDGVDPVRGPSVRLPLRLPHTCLPGGV